MILKQLEMTGFKSFVDTTRLDFTRGFTAVVGPNGCGKSNLSDAIRWVIGEQSSKTLRGTRITDLIFNGSSTRKPVNRTEITLTLGEVPEGLRIANIPNLSEEIKVTRCYHRSGESEFYINGVPCRLKDITDLFLDVGISPKVLTVIEQGHIQDIVTSKPEDRRIWIEEAAGVLKFKARKHEALRKLEAAGQNLDRISDIVQELGRQVESLKRQAAKAERYKQYQSEVKELSLSLFCRKTRIAREDLEQVEEALADRNETRGEWAAQSSTLENRVAELKIEIDELTSALNRKKETLHQIGIQIGKNEHHIDLRNSQVERARQDMESASQEISRMNEEIQANRERVVARQAEREKVAAEIAELEADLEARTREHDHSRGLHQELEAEIQAFDMRVRDLYHRVSQKKNDLTKLEARQNFLKDRDEKLAREQSDTEAQLETARETRAAAQARYEEKAGVFEARTQQQVDAERVLDEKREILRGLEERTQEARERYLAESSLLNSLKELRSKYEGFGEGVKSLMSQTNGSRLDGLRGVLADVVQAPAEYEAAIEAVMGERLQSMIVNSYSDSVEAVRYLHEHKSGRGSFIPMQPKTAPLGPLYLNGDQGVIGKLADLVQTPEEYHSIFQDLLGHVVLVRDLDTALHLHSQENFQGTVVTLNGEVIDSQGVVTGGSHPDSAAGLLAQNRQIDELTQRAAEGKTALDEVLAEKNRLAEEIAGLEQEQKELGAAVHQAELDRTHSYRDLEQAEVELGRLEGKMSTLEYERSTGGHELQELSGEFERITLEMNTVDEERRTAEAQLESMRATHNEQRADLERQGNEINELKVRLASLKGQAQNVMLEIQRLEQQQDNLNQRIAKREDDSHNNARQIEQCREEIEDYQQQILEQSRQKETLSAEVVQEEELLNEKDAMLEDLEKEARNLLRQIQDISEEISRLELRRSEIRLQISHVEERAWEDFNVHLDDVLDQYSEEIDEGEVSEKLSGLKDKVAKMGEVNLAALSDFQVANERYIFLQKQQDDLAESIHSLHQTIERIEKTTKHLFLETFEQVNEHFKGIFQRLFLGGKAELSLSDPDNPLESGIEITASPLGKTMHNITLLSGGEKSMTALALIFSILKVRPSPFCLLDEVDAALDEANVVRFQEMMREMADKTQFIIITHNQKSMSFADTLYGVTMEERGVSKVVSVHLN